MPMRRFILKAIMASNSLADKKWLHNGGWVGAATDTWITQWETWAVSSKEVKRMFKSDSIAAMT